MSLNLCQTKTEEKNRGETKFRKYTDEEELFNKLGRKNLRQTGNDTKNMNINLPHRGKILVEFVINHGFKSQRDEIFFHVRISKILGRRLCNPQELKPPLCYMPDLQYKY